MWGLSEERAAVLLQPRPVALSVLHPEIKRGRSIATPCRYNSLGDEKQPSAGSGTGFPDVVTVQK
jgi:hypothetical protein